MPFGAAEPFSPFDGETNVPFAPVTLSWGNDPFAKQYDLYLWQGSPRPPTPYVSGLTVPAWSGIIPAGVYNWQILSVGVDAGEEVWSPVSSITFTTEPPTRVGNWMLFDAVK